MRWVSVRRMLTPRVLMVVAIALTLIAVLTGVTMLVNLNDDDSGASAVGSGASDADLLVSLSTPSYHASKEACPVGLPELRVIRTAPPTVALEPFINLHGATVIAFLQPQDGGAAADQTSATADPASDTPIRGFVGTRNGIVWSFVAEPAVGGGAVGGGTAGLADAGELSTMAVLSTEPVINLSNDTGVEHDQGLVGMAIGPNSEWLYLNRTAANGQSVLTGYALAATSASALTGRTPTSDGRTPYAAGGGAALPPLLASGVGVELLRIDQPSAQHNGGDIVFGPQGHMYVSFGDGGGLGDPLGNGQDLTTPLGAVLRLVVDPTAPTDRRALGARGNPYAAAEGGAVSSSGAASAVASAAVSSAVANDDRIWVSGVRNPYRMSYDSATGRLWVVDVGQQCLEEVTVLSLDDGVSGNIDEGGADLGWNVYEGSRPFLGEQVRPHRQPNFVYSHSRNLCATVGGHVYRGSLLAGQAGLAGQYVWADLCGRTVFALNPADLDINTSAGTTSPLVVDLGIAAEVVVGLSADPAGELYVIDLLNGIGRLVPVQS